MTATDSTLEVQKAVVALIRADVGVNQYLTGGVYEEIPQNAGFPYMAVADIQGQPAVETQSGEGFECVMTLHVWDRSHQGSINCKRICAALVDLLNNATPTLDTKTVVMFRLISQNYRRTDQREWQAIQRWQVITDG